MKKSIKYIASLALGVSATALVGCSADDYSLASPSVSPEELVEGIAFSVTPDANDPNTIYLKSLMKGVTPCWETPSGRSQNEVVKLELPFSGEYTVKFGVTTGAGLVWGEPYTFTLAQNNFEMLSDEIWTNLAGGVDENGNGNPKVWVPMDKTYLPYKGSAPVGYMNPDDVMNDGSNVTDITLGNWNFNWDPGFQSWLIPAEDPYMNSEMTLSLDPVKGCVAQIKRVDSNGETDVTGIFNLNVSDRTRPTISFSDCEMLHAAWGDGVCSNYSKDLNILEVNPYVLQIATMRTNSEGAWWIVWNFVAKDVRDGIVSIPSDAPDLLEKTPVKLPEYENLAKDLFTISGDEASYVATQTTFLLDEETPYDFIWWNGATAAWEWVNGYGSTWAPAYENAGDFALTLNENGKVSLESAEGAASTTFTIEGNKIVFADEINLLSTGNISIKAKEFTVMKCSADNNEVVFGIPVEKDANGDDNKFLCAKMTIKPIGGGQTGPIVIPVDNSKLNCYVEAKDHYRIELYNPWGDKEWPIDVSTIKLKKNQTMKLTFRLNGVTWKSGVQPKALFANNIDALGFSWPSNGSGFDVDSAFAVNTAGETTISLTNTTDSTVKFDGSSCITVCIQVKDLVESPLDENGIIDASAITAEVTSLTIE